MTLATEKTVIAITLGALLHPIFQGVAALATTRSIPAPQWLNTPLDRALPVVPEAVWIYVSWYPASVVLFLVGRETLRRAYLAYVVAFVVCIVSHLVFPATINRPDMSEAVDVSGRLLAALYAVDPPINLFPSFHAAVAAVLWRLRPASWHSSTGTSAWAIALCLACVLTKQHYVLDVIVGVIVGTLALAVVDASTKRHETIPGAGIGAARRRPHHEANRRIARRIG